MNAIAAAYFYITTTAIAANCVICDAWRMRGAVHYDDTAMGVMFHTAKLLINIFNLHPILHPISRRFSIITVHEQSIYRLWQGGAYC